MKPFQQKLEKEIKQLEREKKLGKASDGELKRLEAYKEILRSFKVTANDTSVPVYVLQ